MRSLNPLFAATTLILAMVACSPKPAAETAEATPITEDGMATTDVAGAAGPSSDMSPPREGGPQDRPQGMPADPNRPMGRGFEGNMTLADMQARSDRRFDRMDVNGDGVITSDEMGDGEGRGGRMLERADANNDGRITRAEMQAGTAAMFRRMDSNGDGKVTEEERPQY